MTKRTLSLLGLLTLALLAYWRLYKHGVKVQTLIAAPTLRPQDEAKIIVDPVHHTVTTVRRVGNGQVVKQAFLPSRQTSVLVERNGEINVQAEVFGTEVSPFIGAGFSVQPRIVCGVGLVYFHRLDLNAGVSSALRSVRDIRGFVSLSYNVYNNTSLFVGVQNDKTLIGGVSVRF